MENIFNRVENIVIKIGTAAITTADNSINQALIDKLAENCSNLIDYGKCISIVTSGAIACGKGKVQGYDSTNHYERFAALGQPILMQAYIESFDKYKKNVGQILLTDDDFDSRKRFAQIKKTYYDLLTNKEIPIFNENDVTAIEEIAFGDNDKLAAKITTELNQDILLNLTVYDGLLKNGKTVEIAISYDEKDYDDLSREIRRGGSGGLKSKLKSAKICTDAGKICRIANSNNYIIHILKGEVPSTTFYL